MLRFAWRFGNPDLNISRHSYCPYHALIQWHWFLLLFIDWESVPWKQTPSSMSWRRGRNYRSACYLGYFSFLGFQYHLPFNIHDHVPLLKRSLVVQSASWDRNICPRGPDEECTTRPRCQIFATVAGEFI